MDRKNLMDVLDDLYNKACEAGRDELAEEILTDNHASEDDSDPNEGYMSTMSDKDLTNAIAEFKRLLKPQSIQDVIDDILSRNWQRDQYDRGFIDACMQANEEFDLGLTF